MSANTLQLTTKIILAEDDTYDAFLYFDLDDAKEYLKKYHEWKIDHDSVIYYKGSTRIGLLHAMYAEKSSNKVSRDPWHIDEKGVAHYLKHTTVEEAELIFSLGGKVASGGYYEVGPIAKDGFPLWVIEDFVLGAEKESDYPQSISLTQPPFRELRLLDENNCIDKLTNEIYEIELESTEVRLLGVDQEGNYNHDDIALGSVDANDHVEINSRLPFELKAVKGGLKHRFLVS